MKKQDGAWQGESFLFLPGLSTQSRERLDYGWNSHSAQLHWDGPGAASFLPRHRKLSRGAVEVSYSRGAKGREHGIGHYTDDRAKPQSH